MQQLHCFFCRVTFLALMAFITSCASYQFGYQARKLPGGYQQVAIPVFKNKSNETGAEVAFTNALITEFGRYKVGQVVDREEAPVVIEGTILSVSVGQSSELIKGGEESTITSLPEGAVLASAYRIVVTSRIVLRRTSDGRIIWEDNFLREASYQAPRIGSPGLNSSNALYNQSIRRQTLESLALLMMEDVHSNMTENF